MWLSEDETPGRYGGTVDLDFLMQANLGFVFRKLSDAPQQAIVDFGFGADIKTDYYQLFLSNAVYLFETADGSNQVYILTQTE